MCGICGILNFDRRAVDQSTLTSMCDAMRHRGPDGEGQLVDRHLGLGHRRLSIIDVGGGAQPIGNEDGAIQVVFNGEIYNFIELRLELEGCGHRFRTKSDTEVIVHAYEQWGAECVKRFNGMFGFALWDKRNETLFIARDHLGIKPLYYHVSGNRLVFASEIKPILKCGVARSVDVNAVAELFTFRYVPSPKTLFSGIHKLPPGHYMLVRDGRVTVTRFWTTTPQFRSRLNEGELIEEYQSLLEDAVRLQLRSDVPLGLFLSSGVDSCVLLAIMSKYTKGAVKAFTIGFEDGERTNEVDDAREMAQLFGADHHVQIIGPEDYTRYYERYMRDLEEPVGNETAAAFYFVSRIARQHVTVTLSGQGADEPWAGYDRHKGMKFSALYSRLPSAFTSAMASTLGKVSARAEKLSRGMISLGEADMLTRLTKVYSFFSEEMKSKLYKGALLDTFSADPFGPRFALSAIQSDVRDLDPLTQVLYIDTRTNLPDDLLMVGDKTSMANSLESRVPFLDYRLVEFVEQLPPHLKINRLTAKYLHKLSCQKWLPRSVTHRKKKGFANPVEAWFRQKMSGFVDECLLSPDSGVAEHFDQRYIQRILKMDRQGTAQFRRQIYLLVSYELWHREFIRN